jgi:hypothetical protein
LYAFLALQAGYYYRDSAAAASLTRKAMSWLAERNIRGSEQLEHVADVLPRVLVMVPQEAALLRAARSDKWWAQHDIANNIAAGLVTIPADISYSIVGIAVSVFWFWLVPPEFRLILLAVLFCSTLTLLQRLWSKVTTRRFGRNV